MAKPTALPIFNTTETDTTVMTAPHQSVGFAAPAGVPEKPTYDEFNYWMNNVYKWVKANNIHGILPYDALIDDYIIGSLVVGSDYNIYRCLIANGPSTAAVNPVGDGTGTWVHAITGLPGTEVNLPFEPTATQLSQMRLLERDGSSLLDASYAELLTAIGGKLYGNADASHFYLPDDRGLFVRILDNGAGNDPGADVTQTGTIASGSPVITGFADTSVLEVGMAIVVAGIPGGTFIISIDSATQITVDNNATASGAVSCSFYNRLDRGDGTIGDEVGTEQSEAFKAHDHTGYDVALIGIAGGASAGAWIGNSGITGDLDTRPINRSKWGGIYY